MASFCQLSHEPFVVAAPEGARLLVPDTEQVDLGSDLLDELSRLLRFSQLRAVVNVAADPPA